MGDRGHNAGGFAWMPRVSCTRCGAIFPIGKSNPRRVCANVAKCDARIARVAAKAIKVPPETLFIRKLADSPFKGPNDPYPAGRPS